jgi:hypothetical protein
LREEQPGLDGLAETDLVGQDRPLREWALKREKRGFDLVGVQIYLGILRPLHVAKGRNRFFPFNVSLPGKGKTGVFWEYYDGEGWDGKGRKKT